MKLQLLAVGKLRVPYFEAGVHEYLTRIEHMLPIEQIEVPSGSGEESNGKGEGTLVREGERLLRLVKPHTVVVTMDAAGQQMTSEQFSQWIQERMNESTERIAFIIGGAWGIDKRITKISKLRLSLSKMTMPHELARLVLVEQIYRALTLWKGHPYHK
ncbi:23S rRNA (pseudouridine(1915)-N(3))-methyltransferase RlmH [bacterium]|nr:23S rRNA (pseudouridine(1915)-N(3))-methyltransferase RlmH [bacterium]